MVLLEVIRHGCTRAAWNRSDRRHLPDPASPGPASVRTGPLDAVDDDEVLWRAGRHQFQAGLLLDGGQDLQAPEYSLNERADDGDTHSRQPGELRLESAALVPSVDHVPFPVGENAGELRRRI